MMKWILLAIAILGAPLKADVVFTTFSQEIIYGTDTLQDSNGAVTGTVQYVAWGGEIAPDIALDFQNDTTLLPGYPAAAAAIQSASPAATLTDDLTFLTRANIGINVVWANNGNAPIVGDPNVTDITVPAQIADALYPGDSLVSTSPEFTLGQAVYSTAAYENPTTILEGTATFDIFEFDFDQQAPPVPEPSTLPLLVFVVLVARTQTNRKIS